jgi:hypothetical protein
VAGLNCSLRDTWPSPRVVWACFGLPEYLLDLPRVSLSLGPRASYRVLECLGLSFACGRVEVDGDVMVARLVRLVFKDPFGAGRLHGRQLLFPHDVEICSSPRIGSAAPVVRPGPRTSQI